MDNSRARTHRTGDVLPVNPSARRISAVSTCAPAFMSDQGQISLSAPFGSWIPHAATELAAELLDISHDHAAAVAELGLAVLVSRAS